MDVLKQFSTSLMNNAFALVQIPLQYYRTLYTIVAETFLKVFLKIHRTPLSSDEKFVYFCEIAFLSSICSNKSLGLSPLEQLEAEKRERESKITKTESEMEQVFETKVKEKRKKLKEMEAEVEEICF